ncbi:MAG TPA: translocation/assembly module TamB domain-containing protein [Vicinamibacteria bacterium]|nr:translocation/assembly module TamB domain-containing protein [Vicinamibacteria bacterium]
MSEELDLRGVVTASGHASLDPGGARVEARLRSEELGFREIVARDVSGRAELADGVLRMRDIEGRAFGGRVVLASELSVHAGGRRALDLSWEGVDPKEVVLALASKRLPLSSRSAGRIHMDLGDGTADGATGSAEIRLTPVGSRVLPSAAGVASASLAAGVLHLSPSTLVLSSPRIRLDMNGTVGLDGRLALGVSARVDAASLPSLPMRAAGDVDVLGEIHGTIATPSWTARLSSRDLLLENESFELTGTVAGDLEVATTDGVALEGGRGRLEVRGIAPLTAERTWSLDLLGNALELPEMGPLRVVVAEASGHLEGPARAPDAAGVVRLYPVSLQRQEGEARLSIQKHGSTITVDDLEASIGRRGRLDGSGTYDIETGGIEANLDVYSGEGLALSGTGGIVDGRVDLARSRFTLSKLSAGFELEGTRVIVSALSASVGPGTLSGGGFVDLGSETIAVNLEAEARRVPFQFMDGLRFETSGSLRLASVDDFLRLSGNLALERGLLTREIDNEDAGFSSRQMALRDPKASAGLADRMALDVTITTRRNLVVENSIAQLELAGNVTVGGTLVDPEVRGIVTVVPDGEIRIGRNRFQVRHGRLDLRGFPLTPPRLDLAAVTRVGQTIIQIELEGDADDLSTRLSAPDSPDLTEGDLASLLVTGRTLEEAGQGGQQMATTWMMASLADLVHEGLGDLISYGPPPGAGPLILAEEADPTSRLTLGVPLGKRLSATYSIALNDAEKRLWILDYRVARNIWLRGIQENSSDFTFGVSQRFELGFRGRPRTERPDDSRPDSAERIAGVSVEGAPAGFEWQPNARAGDRYDYWSVQDEARRLVRRLVAKGYVSAIVEVRADPEDTRVQVLFEIRAGKRARFVWSGDDPGKDLRQAIEGAWDGRIPETFLLPDLAERVRTTLLPGGIISPASTRGSRRTRPKDESSSRSRADREASGSISASRETTCSTRRRCGRSFPGRTSQRSFFFSIAAPSSSAVSGCATPPPGTSTPPSARSVAPMRRERAPCASTSRSRKARSPGCRPSRSKAPPPSRERSSRRRWASLSGIPSLSPRFGREKRTYGPAIGKRDFPTRGSAQTSPVPQRAFGSRSPSTREPARSWERFPSSETSGRASP